MYVYKYTYIYTICQFLSSIIHTKLTTLAGPRVQLQFPCVPLPCFQRRTCHKVMQISLSNISFLETQSILMFDAVKRHPAIGEYNCKFIAVMKPLPTDMQQVLTSSEKRIPMLKITVCSMLGQLPQTLWMNDLPLECSKPRNTGKRFRFQVFACMRAISSTSKSYLSI